MFEFNETTQDLSDKLNPEDTKSLLVQVLNVASLLKQYDYEIEAGVNDSPYRIILECMIDPDPNYPMPEQTSMDQQIELNVQNFKTISELLDLARHIAEELDLDTYELIHTLEKSKRSITVRFNIQEQYV